MLGLGLGLVAQVDRGCVAQAVEQQPPQLRLLVVAAVAAAAAYALRVRGVALPQPQPDEDQPVLLARDLEG